MDNKDKRHVISALANAQVQESPFFHIEIDNFFPTEVADKLYDEFPSFDSSVWFDYKNKIEDKKLLSDWRKFPKETYQAFTFLNSSIVLEALSNLAESPLYSDHGLHGGGWHIHANGGKLNPHLDYSLHPMLKLQRKLNLIVYLCKDWDESYGGHFGLWTQDADKKRAGELVKEIPMGFNKAVIFDTTQNSWHGLSREVSCPANQYRKSMAVYYLTTPPQGTDSRNRALFSPTAKQREDEGILELIEKRADFEKSKEVYTKND